MLPQHILNPEPLLLQLFPKPAQILTGLQKATYQATLSLATHRLYASSPHPHSMALQGPESLPPDKYACLPTGGVLGHADPCSTCVAPKA